MKLENELKEVKQQLNNVNNDGFFKDEDIVSFGLLSIEKDHVRIDLLMDEDLFKEEDLKKLKNVAQELQDMLIAIYQRNN